MVEMTRRKQQKNKRVCLCLSGGGVGKRSGWCSLLSAQVRNWIEWVTTNKHNGIILRFTILLRGERQQHRQTLSPMQGAKDKGYPCFSFWLWLRNFHFSYLVMLPCAHLHLMYDTSHHIHIQPTPPPTQSADMLLARLIALWYFFCKNLVELTTKCSSFNVI